MEHKRLFLDMLIRNLKRTAVIVVLLGSYMLIMNLLTGTSCAFKSFIGVPCPGCGLTRAYMSLFRLDIRGAFVWHPMFWAVPVFIAAWIWREYVKAKYPGRHIFFYEPLLFVLSISAIAVFVVRAFYLFPHTEPFTLNPNAVMPRLFRLIKNGFDSIFT